MKKKRSRALIFFAAALILAAAAASSGCKDKNPTGQTSPEPDITVEYLKSEYAEQLLRDGAQHLFGSIRIVNDENGNPILKIQAKEFVSDPAQEKGYYIADKNQEFTYPLSPEARTTFLQGDSSLPVILSAEAFVKAVTAEAKTADLPKNLSGRETAGVPSDPAVSGSGVDSGGEEENPGSEKLYDIYIILDQVEMVLAFYLP